MQLVCTLLSLELPHQTLGPGVRPGNRIVQRFTGVGVPYHGGFALVSDSNGFDVRDIMTLVLKSLGCLFYALLYAIQNFFGVVFMPPASSPVSITSRS